MVNYEGEKGAERLLRMIFANGNAGHYEGEKGAERVVRIVGANGTVAWSTMKARRAQSRSCA